MGEQLCECGHAKAMHHPEYGHCQSSCSCDWYSECSPGPCHQRIHPKQGEGVNVKVIYDDGNEVFTCALMRGHDGPHKYKSFATMATWEDATPKEGTGR